MLAGAPLAGAPLAGGPTVSGGGGVDASGGGSFSFTGSGTAITGNGAFGGGSFNFTGSGTVAVALSASGGGSFVFTGSGAASTPGGGPPTHMVLTVQPRGGVSGAGLSIQPVLEARRDDDTLATGYTGSVLASVGEGASALSGTASISFVGGVAPFTNL